MVQFFCLATALQALPRHYAIVFLLRMPFSRLKILRLIRFNMAHHSLHSL